MMLANEGMIQNEDEILDGFLPHKSKMFSCGHKSSMFSAVIPHYQKFFILCLISSHRRVRVRLIYRARKVAS